MSKIKRASIAQTPGIWMDNMQTTGNDTPLTAHLNWDARIRRENKDRFQSTIDVRSSGESKNILGKIKSGGAGGVGECLNVSSQKNLEVE